jgi:hypothetical protein
MKSAIFWDVTPYSVAEVSEEHYIFMLIVWHLFGSEAARPSETSVRLYQAAMCRIRIQLDTSRRGYSPLYCHIPCLRNTTITNTVSIETRGTAGR